MNANQNEILELMEHYTDATGIGLYCLDQSLVLQPFSTAGWSFPELGALDFAEVGWHMLEKTKSPSQAVDCYETFLTRQGFIYLIRDLKIRRGAHSARWYLISEPMVEKQLGRSELQAMPVCDPMADGADTLSACPIKPAAAESESNADPIRHLPAMPVISRYRVSQLGKTLDYLCVPLLGRQSGKRPSPGMNPAMCGCMTNLRYPEESTDENPSASIDVHSIARALHGQVRGIIRNGQVSALLDLERAVDFNSLPVQVLSAHDQLLVTKDIFIAFCTLLLHSAVESGLPYARMLRLADQQIDKVQRMTRIQDVLTHMKAAVAAYTYAVHLDQVDQQIVPRQTSHRELLTTVKLARA